jgi:hypothetical protein
MSTEIQSELDGSTWRSACGRARATYRSDWSPARPFITYVRGTAGAQFPTLRGALSYLEERGFKGFKEEG